MNSRRHPIKSWRALLLPSLLGISLLGVYFATLAPGLTWANGGTDGGDLITAAATGGISHPTGYPLYLILAGLFQFLPAGSLAYRTNLMSAVFTTLASVLIYRTVLRHFSQDEFFPYGLAALAAGYCFGLAPLVWSQAVITEVYALQAFLVVLILYLYSKPVPESQARQKALDRWRGLALGLAMSNHSTSILIVPLALLLGATHTTTIEAERTPQAGWRGLIDFKFNLSSLGRQLLWMGFALCLYLVLPLRALANPPVSWGNPLSLQGFWWIVSGELYRGVYLQPDVSHLLTQILDWMGYTLAQIGLLALLLALLGLIMFSNFSRLTLLTVWAALTSLVFASLYRPSDAEVYLIPLLASVSIWLGIGIGGLVEYLLQHSPAIAIVVGLLFLGIVLLRPVSYLRQVDASQDRRAEVFGREILSIAPENAILFARGDKAIFALWYFHFALHERPDLAVVATELLSYDWYHEALRSTYPSLSIEGAVVYPETVMRANPQRMICLVQYTDQAEMECTSPLAVFE